jgi:hypothetical protein
LEGEKLVQYSVVSTGTLNESGQFCEVNVTSIKLFWIRNIYVYIS